MIERPEQFAERGFRTCKQQTFRAAAWRST
jgi:hypothetical protein